MWWTSSAAESPESILIIELTINPSAQIELQNAGI